MKKQLPADLLNKYLTGQCNAQEEATVNEWYNSFVNDDDHVSSLNKTDHAALKIRMRNTIEQNIEFNEDTQAQPKHARLHYLYYSAASVAALILLAVGLGLFHTPGKSAATPEVINLLSITNNTKTIHEQILSDGSHVWLYPGANIRFAKKFDGPTREISMTGESFFDVAKDAAHPFIIHSKHMITKVWGTSFRVRDNGTYADVIVVTGKVSVKPVDNKVKVTEIMLHPHDQVTLLKKHDSLKIDHDVNSPDLAIWKKLNLAFDNKPLKEVLPVLNKQFNVTITSADERLNNYLLDADLNGLNFASVMEILKKTLNISYEINDTAIVLKNNNQ